MLNMSKFNVYFHSIKHKTKKIYTVVVVVVERQMVERKRATIGERQMGSALMGSLQIAVFSTDGHSGYSRYPALWL